MTIIRHTVSLYTTASIEIINVTSDLSICTANWKIHISHLFNKKKKKNEGKHNKYYDTCLCLSFSEIDFQGLSQL